MGALDATPICPDIVAWTREAALANMGRLISVNL